MSRLAYACRFEVQPSGAIDVVDEYRRWIVEHYRQKRGIDNLPFEPAVATNVIGLPADHHLSSEIFEAQTGKVIRIRWSFPGDNDNTLRWSNDIRIGLLKDATSVEHLIYIGSVEYNVMPACLNLGSPWVVRQICGKAPVYVGEMQVKAAPYFLDGDGLDDLMNVLTNPVRRLPVVLLSPYARGGGNNINADQLARDLAGVAVVVDIGDPELTWDLAEVVGRRLSCFNGAARIYWSGFGLDSDPLHHRLFLSAWIEQIGPENAARVIERTIFAVAAFRFVPDRRISEVVDAAESAQRHRQLEEKKADGDDFWEDYERTLAKLDDNESRIRELEAENANLKANQEILFTGEFDVEATEEGQPHPERKISTVEEAVKVASEKCHDVEFLPSAYDSASKSPFHRPTDVFEALMDLQRIVEAWRSQRDQIGSGGDLLQHLRDHGWGKRSRMHISETTKGKYRSSYEFKYQDKRQIFEPHITIGSGDAKSCASIHFIFDQQREKMIVAHAGRHLPNTKT